MLGATLLLAVLSCSPGADWPASDLADVDPLALSSEMELFLAEKIDPQTPPMLRLEQLLRLILTDDSLNFTYSPQTKPASQTFAERSGNCLSFTTMFVAMARHICLEVWFREVEVPPQWSMKRGLVFVSGHMNVVARIGSELYAVDLFPEVNRIEIRGDVIPDHRAMAHFFSNKGAETLATGTAEEAMAYCQKALKLDPEAGFAWSNYGVVAAFLGEDREAEKAYKKALKLEPQNLTAMSNLVRLYDRSGRQSEAKRFSKKVSKFRERNPYYHFMLGEQAYSTGQLEEALEHYREALKRKPREHNFDFALAKVYARLGDLPNVQKYLERAREHAPDPSGRARYSAKLEYLAAHSTRASLNE